MSEYTRLEECIETDPEHVFRRCTELLDENPDDAAALFLAAAVYSRAEKFGFAIALYRRIAELKPDRSEPMNNLGTCYSGLGDIEQAQYWYLKAWGKKHSAINAANVGYTFMEQRKFPKAMEWVERALALDPNCLTAVSTRGFCRLAQGDWAQGWKDWGVTVGGKFRKKLQFKEEPQWTGGKVGTLVVYGEQGIGDEILFASCVEDAARENDIVLECDSRLEGLFRRSFPFAHVYGTRRQKEIAWPNDHDIKAGIPIGQLPEFYRPSPTSCPGAPYLHADPERRLQWRALLDTQPGLKIGIAWSGGSRHNHPKARAAGLEAFRGMIEGSGHTFISLQYKDPTDEIKTSGLDVRHYKRACETMDYDDTAAMVAELDYVVSVPTAVVHLAGALGVKTHCMVHHKADWAFQSGLPWYSSVDLFKKSESETWRACVDRFAKDLHWCGSTPAVGVYGAAALDRPALLAACGYHAADSAATADQA